MKEIHAFGKYNLNTWSGKPVKFCLDQLSFCFQFSKQGIIFKGLLSYTQYLSHNYLDVMGLPWVFVFGSFSNFLPRPMYCFAVTPKVLVGSGASAPGKALH